MPDRLVLLHTMPGVATLFAGLASEILPGEIEVWHVVDEILIKTVLAAGRVTPFIHRRVAEHVIAAEEAGARAVQFTCSSISPCVPVVAPLVGIPVLRIEEAMVQRALALGSRLAVAATAPTALGPVAESVEEAAERKGRPVEVERALCVGAYEALTAGDLTAHDRLVADKVAELARRSDAVLLAQASMARALAALPPSVPQEHILTSPRLALEHVRELFASA
ncbi:MAG: aspartate/glutamate racemase family protein [Anaerolineae bacterium]|nr:aspartate/glutamate racemase family protein [Anaerolineae bacterium]